MAGHGDTMSRTANKKLTTKLHWGRLSRLATWHVPGEPVGPASRWAATSDVELGHTIYTALAGEVHEGKERKEGNERQSHYKEEGKEEVKRGGARGYSSEGLHLHICADRSL